MSQTFNFQPMMILKLTDIAHGGEAMAHVGDRTFFVAYALPGETVRVEVVEQHERWGRGRLLEALDSSPDRATPPCPHFGPDRCGGCQWQHIARPAQLDYKQRIVVDQLQRLGGLSKPVVRPTLDPGPSWGYRTQATFYPTATGGLGLRQPHSYHVHAIDHCPLLHPALAALYEEFNTEWEGLRSVDFSVGVSHQQGLIALRTEDDIIPEIEVDVPVSIVLERSNDEVLTLIGDPWYEETIAGHAYRLSAGTWRPANPTATAALLAVIANYLTPHPGQTLLDLYCGAGLVAFGLAQRLGFVIGVDADPIAIEDCAHNCKMLDNVILHEGQPAQVLPTLTDPANLAVVTAPAAGMGRGVADHLTRLGVRRLAYVAHNPATLARDSGELRRAGYIFQEATPIDVAPQTYYTTTVALFTRLPDRRRSAG